MFHKVQKDLLFLFSFFLFAYNKLFLKRLHETFKSNSTETYRSHVRTKLRSRGAKGQKCE